MGALQQSVTSIGHTAAAPLIARLRKLGPNRRQIRTAVGVAPYASDSGSSRGR